MAEIASSPASPQPKTNPEPRGPAVPARPRPSWLPLFAAVVLAPMVFVGLLMTSAWLASRQQPDGSPTAKAPAPTTLYTMVAVTRGGQPAEGQPLVLLPRDAAGAPMGLPIARTTDSAGMATFVVEGTPATLELSAEGTDWRQTYPVPADTVRRGITLELKVNLPP